VKNSVMGKFHILPIAESCYFWSRQEIGVVIVHAIPYYGYPFISQSWGISSMCHF
jgi:hypothetical protein